MSRTEGINLPRLPAHHARLTSPRAIQPHPAASRMEQGKHRRAESEPSYTAFVGTPRQDVPKHVYQDAAMFDDVFDKKGQLLLSRNTPKISAPLHVLGYSSLHDPHCRKLFLNNKKLRSHLMHRGLITEDLKVVATTTEQRQKIRAHELLERKEQLLQKLEGFEESRIEKLQKQVSVPARYRKSFYKAEERKEKTKEIQRMKIEKLVKAERENTLLEQKAHETRKRKLLTAVEESKLMDQARRNAARAQQELAENVAYQKQYAKFGNKIANWRRESDKIHNQMVAMERKQWIRNTKEAQNTKMKLSDTSRDTLTSRESTTAPQRLPSIGKTATAPQRRPGFAGIGTTSPITAPPSQVAQPLDIAHTATEEPDEPFTAEGLRDEAIVDKIADGVGSLQVEEATAHKPLAEEDELGPENEDFVDEVGASPEAIGEESGSVEDPRAGEMVEEDTEDGVDGLGMVAGSEFEGQLPASAQEVEEVRILEPDEGSHYLSQVILEVFNRGDPSRSGYITTEDFAKMLNIRDLGLQLNEEELNYLAEMSDLYQNGHVHFIQVVPQLPAVLKILYTQRAEESFQLFGVHPEEQWCELHPRIDASSNVCYLHKLTGAMQLGGRPHDFRPFLQDDVFEDAIVDFFETADTNKDGVLSYDDFSAFLISPVIAQRIYNDQRDSLITYYLDACTNPQGWMTLETFAPLARALLLMVYQNTYPVKEEWIELESRKFGNFFFNKTTGETYIPSSPGEQPPRPSPPTEGQSHEGGGEEHRTRRRRSRHHRVSWSDSTTPTDQTTTPSRSAPPPLLRRHSREESREETNLILAPGTRNGEDTDASALSSVPEEPDNTA